MKTSGLSKLNSVLPKVILLGILDQVVAFGVARYDKRNLISLVGRVPGSFLAALVTCLNA